MPGVKRTTDEKTCITQTKSQKQLQNEKRFKSHFSLFIRAIIIRSGKKHLSAKTFHSNHIIPSLWLFCEVLNNHPVVEGILHALYLLGRFVTFTADKNNIALAGFFKREFYRLGPIGLDMNFSA